MVGDLIVKKFKVLYLVLVPLCFVVTGKAAVQDVNISLQSSINSISNGTAGLDYINLAQINSADFVATEEIIKAVQQALNKLGFDAGKVDGLAHNKTVTAIVNFQKQQGITITGEIDPQLLKSLGLR